jgi:hypothetical protein
MDEIQDSLEKTRELGKDLQSKVEGSEVVEAIVETAAEFAIDIVAGIFDS